MKTSLALLGLLPFSAQAFGVDCSQVAPFTPGGKVRAKVTISRFHWTNGNSAFEDLCSSTVTLDWFDVRGRASDAYDCLKAAPREVVVCKTNLGNDAAEVQAVPASWIRSWQPSDVRDDHFHAYVVKESDPGFYLDVFSRSLSFDTSVQHTIIEGSLKTGPSNPDDGFFVRVEFQN